MTTLRLFAIGIDDVRDMFGAEPELAERLRTIAASHFATQPKAKIGLLGWIGPLLGKSLPLTGPGYPDHDDVETILAGRYVTPDKIVAAWRLLMTWLDETAFGSLRLAVTPPELNNLDFDLARAGLSSDFSLDKVFRNDPQIPLLPLAGMRVGYCKYAQALAMGDEISRAVDQVDPNSKDLAVKCAEWLANFPRWEDQALTAGRPVPDIVGAFFTEEG